MIDRLEATLKRYNEIGEELASPEIISDIKKMTLLSKERTGLEKTVEVYKEYKKSRIRSRFDILVNALSSNNRNMQFKNKYQIRQAVRNINDELEEAQRDFDKLFQSEKEYS